MDKQQAAPPPRAQESASEPIHPLITIAGGIFGVLIILTIWYGIRSWGGSEPQPLLPDGYWGKIALASLLTSVFAAISLYIDYLPSYDELQLELWRKAVVMVGLPLLQMLFVVLALITLGGFYSYVFMLLYLGTFLPWDRLIWTAPARSGTSRPTPFQRAVSDYYRNIDFPSFVAVLVMILMLQFYDVPNFVMSPGENAEPFLEAKNAFMTGVLGSQAFAGLTVLGSELVGRRKRATKNYAGHNSK